MKQRFITLPGLRNFVLLIAWFCGFIVAARENFMMEGHGRTKLLTTAAGKQSMG